MATSIILNLAAQWKVSLRNCKKHDAWVCPRPITEELVG